MLDCKGCACGGAQGGREPAAGGGGAAGGVERWPPPREDAWRVGGRRGARQNAFGQPWGPPSTFQGLLFIHLWPQITGLGRRRLLSTCSQRIGALVARLPARRRVVVGSPTPYALANYNIDHPSLSRVLTQIDSVQTSSCRPLLKSRFLQIFSFNPP